MKEAIPFILQGTLMAIDEFYCHRRRELKRWERVGHPLDSLFFLVSLLWILLNAPSAGALTVYAVLGVAGSLFITKDEWQHKTLCSGFENWLHAILFMLHPVMLIVAGWMWWNASPVFTVVVGSVAGAVGLFAFYQAFYWNFLR